MKAHNGSLTTRLLKDQRGQMLPVMALMVVAFLGMAAVSIDVGNVYTHYRQLEASTSASAMAGAQSLPSTSATTAAENYSASNATMVTGYPKLECLTTLTGEGMACIAPANANAIQVEEQMVVPLYFGGIFGKPSMTITATSTAAMRGSQPSPYNVAIIVDTTASMGDTDSDSQCSASRLSCALSGVRILLQDMSPCGAGQASCGSVTTTASTATTVTSSSVTNSVDRVSLFTFPNITLSDMPDEYACSSGGGGGGRGGRGGGGSSLQGTTYTFPSATATSYNSMGSPAVTYQVLGYSSDYRSSDSATSLSSSSNLVMAVGGVSGCSGMSDPGGAGTYYAGVIYAAQSSLVAEQAANPGSQNVIIMISDGDADSTGSTDMGSASTTSGTYASSKDECAQAVTAGKAAATAGTKVYTVAYGAESSGCQTDSPSITPCQTMEGIASASQNFFSDYTAKGGTSSCVSASQPTTNLDQIFTDIASDLTVARLIPNGTT